MERGLTGSIILHTLLLLLLAFGFPALLDLKPEDPTPMAMSVELVPVSEISNLKKSKLPVRDREESKPKQAKPKPIPPKPVAEPEKPKPTVVKPAEKKPEEKKKPEPEKKKEKEVLKDLTPDKPAAEEAPEKEAKEEASTRSASDNYDPTVPISLSTKDSIRSQFAKCWRMPAGVRGDYTLKVAVRVLMNPDGSVRQAGIKKEQAGRYRSDPIFRAAADSALRAVKLCSPLKGLPADRYKGWSDMVVNFDPREMLY